MNDATIERIRSRGRAVMRRVDAFHIKYQGALVLDSDPSVIAVNRTGVAVRQVRALAAPQPLR